MNKKELLQALKDAEYVYVPVWYRNGKDWKYVTVDKESIIEEVKSSHDSQYFVDCFSKGFVWFDFPLGSEK
jgi:hypothetical protein